MIAELAVLAVLAVWVWCVGGFGSLGPVPAYARAHYHHAADSGVQRTYSFPH